MSTAVEEMEIWQTLALAIENADTAYEVRMIAMIIRRGRFPLEVLDSLRLVWGHLQDRMDCPDTRDILDVIDDKRQKAEKEQEEKMRQEADDIWR